MGFYSELRDKLARMPGVSSATFGDLPLRGGGMNAGGGDPFGIQGRSYDAASGPVTQFANAWLRRRGLLPDAPDPSACRTRTFTEADFGGEIPPQR